MWSMILIFLLTYTKNIVLVLIIQSLTLFLIIYYLLVIQYLFLPYLNTLFIKLFLKHYITLGDLLIW